MSQLQPDVLVPSQMLHGHPWSGERRLMLAVLEEALGTMFRRLRVVGEITPSARQAIEDAERWLMSDDRSAFFSFLNVCDACHIDPHYLRSGIVEARRRRIALSTWDWKRDSVGRLKASNTRLRSVR